MWSYICRLFHAGYDIKSLETVENTNNLIKSLAFSLKKEVYKNSSKTFSLVKLLKPYFNLGDYFWSQDNME